MPSLPSYAPKTALGKGIANMMSGGDKKAEPEPADQGLPCAPVFKNDPACAICDSTFRSMTGNVRHHCRACGDSVCASHSSKRSPVPYLGFESAVRVCDKCFEGCDSAALAARRAAKLERLEAYFAGTLQPYDDGAQQESKDDSAGARAARVGTLTLNAASKVPGAGAIRSGAKAINFAATYGLAGVAGIVLRSEIVEAAETAQVLLGDTSEFTVQDMSAGLYYLLSRKRGERGDHPDGEHEEHKGCPVADDDTLADVCAFAPMALIFAYQGGRDDIQRLAAQQGFSLVYSMHTSSHEKPAFLLAIHEATKTAVLAVRGTDSVHDIVTDIKAIPSPFIEGHSAHAGIGRAAHWLHSEAGPSLLRCAERGYKVVLTGHSLGAASSALLAILLRPEIPTVRCVNFACPAVADLALATGGCREFITSVVFHDDVIPRASGPSMRGLLEELLDFRATWKQMAAEDVAAAKARARNFWAPTRRHRRPSAGSEASACKQEEKKMTPQLSEEKLQAAGAAREGGEEEEAEELPSLHPPGRVLHIYHHCGRWELVDVANDFPALARIELYENMLDDHRGVNYWNALRSVRRSRQHAVDELPSWTPFAAVDECMACHSDFAWNSTATSEAAQNRCKNHCYRCGGVYCDQCSRKREAVPELAIFDVVRVCDVCAFSSA